MNYSNFLYEYYVSVTQFTMIQSLFFSNFVFMTKGCLNNLNHFEFYKYLFQGEHLAESVQMKHVPVTVLAWHPTKRILATAWESGEVSIWNEQDRELYEASRVHKEPISCIKWSTTGTRLVTTDTVSMVVVPPKISDQCCGYWWSGAMASVHY